jgi:hypothetical protein
MGFLDLFIGNNRDFCLNTLMKTPCIRVVSYVVANKMTGKAYTINWEGLNRKLSGLVLRTVGLKNSALVGSLYVSDRVGVNASEIHSLNLDAVCLAC